MEVVNATFIAYYTRRQDKTLFAHGKEQLQHSLSTRNVYFYTLLLLTLLHSELNTDYPSGRLKLSSENIE